ncbi:MAG: signal peptidase I [Bacillota bacterium]
MFTMDKEEAERRNRSRRIALTMSFIGLVVVSILIFLVPGVMRTDSMGGVVRDGDVTFMNRMAYSQKVAPGYGDVTMFKAEGADGKLVNVPTRVIGNDDDVIEIKDGAVYRNGELLEEDYAIGDTEPGDNGKTKFTVPEESVFVLGDNRADAIDSRDVGCLSRRELGGKMVFRVLPLGEMGKIQ